MQDAQSRLIDKEAEIGQLRDRVMNFSPRRGAAAVAAAAAAAASAAAVAPAGPAAALQQAVKNPSRLSPRRPLSIAVPAWAAQLQV